MSTNNYPLDTSDIVIAIKHQCEETKKPYEKFYAMTNARLKYTAEDAEITHWKKLGNICLSVYVCEPASLPNPASICKSKT